MGSYLGGDVIDDYCEFAGHAFEIGTGGPFCMKLDNNGQILWVSYPAEANRAGESIAVGEDEVFLGQGYGTFGGGGHYWDDVYFDRPSGHGADPAVIHLDKTTGEALQIYDIMGPGYGDDDEITAVAVDKLGNVVAGGYMTSPWLFDGHPVVPQMDKRSPNPSDFFIAKLGKDGVSCDDEWMAVKKAADTEIRLWPNPTKGKLHIEIDGVINDIKVYDVTGRISLSNQSVEKGTNSTVLNLNALPAGIYFIRIFTSGHQQTFKVIKE
ncbi:T9SS type A sorting domain-containing protein [Mesonia ostreae]|uniref:T9SS type A sorting domain-containing protein n=1 Tax=Mesonia ostreae TaxID=861110 RepID=A0ABU2KKY4_9FLAO|nr:T9SS type A sorting domain-containing protein [Mesonia ostreae]MDT0295334.1 T9SS type A sorting domain-containing protein [Mesonia ostreae]